MLELYAIPQQSDLQPTVIFQQDGAPPHWALEVRRTLDKTFPARWIGWGGPPAWPPRSPDMTPLDFFLWGYVTDQVYSTRVIDHDDLKARIRAAIATVDIDILRRVWNFALMLYVPPEHGRIYGGGRTGPNPLQKAKKKIKLIKQDKK